MSKAGVEHSEIKKLLMKDEVFKEEYEKLKLRDELLTVEQDHLAGCTGYTPNELDKYLDSIIEEVGRGKDSVT